MTALLTVEELTVQYGGLRAVDAVSMSVESGSLVGLIGPNGAGKTTFIDAVTGLVSARGRIVFDGEEIQGLPAYRRSRKGLARTFQSLELFEELTVRENLLVTAEPSRWWSPVVDAVRPKATASATAAVEEALELVGLSDRAGALPTELSLGDRKLVTVARALAGRPKFVLLDEPAAGLDSDESLALGRTLRDVAHSGTTILLVDHDMGLVLGVCDLIQVLEFGQLIATGTPNEIRENERVIGAYLGVDDEAETAQEEEVRS